LGTGLPRRRSGSEAKTKRQLTVISGQKSKNRDKSKSKSKNKNKNKNYCEHAYIKYSSSCVMNVIHVGLDCRVAIPAPRKDVLLGLISASRLRSPRKDDCRPFFQKTCECLNSSCPLFKGGVPKGRGFVPKKQVNLQTYTPFLGLVVNVHFHTS